MSDIKAAREAFLNLIGDATDWGIDYDGDTNDSGHMIDCSHYHIRGPLQSLRELCEELGIRPKSYDQSLDDAIQEAVEADPPGRPIELPGTFPWKPKDE
jgi:hypothetical protein